MSGGVPVRLSGALAARARTAAEVLDRSLTEQVEHWARLGQVVEDAILAATVHRLKARSHDPELAQRLAFAATAEGRAKAAKLIRERNPVRHGADERGALVRIGPGEKRRARPPRSTRR
jgi:ParD-like antitoxin of type II bacterial toxin-antitoxin system